MFPTKFPNIRPFIKFFKVLLISGDDFAKFAIKQCG